MQIETKLDYINKKYTNKINSLETHEERQKAARKMLDKCSFVLTKKEKQLRSHRCQIGVME